MNREIQQRLKWVSLYEESRDAGFVCRRCGISRPTLRNWWLHYQLNGIEGLRSHNRRPLHPPNTKVSDHYEKLILGLRTQHNLGARRIQSELLRQHTLSLGLATIHKVLQKHEVKPIKKLRKKNDYIRYTRSLPGDRVQMDT